MGTNVGKLKRLRRLNIFSSNGRVRITKRHAEPIGDVQGIRGKMSSNCLWHACQAFFLGLILFLIGAAMITLGFYSEGLFDFDGNFTQNFNKKSTDDRPKNLKFSKLAYGGPIVMGVGGFIIVSTCVLLFEARDSAAKVGPSAYISHGNQKTTSALFPHHPRTHSVDVKSVASQTDDSTSSATTGTHFFDKKIIKEAIRKFKFKRVHQGQKFVERKTKIEKSPSAPNLNELEEEGEGDELSEGSSNSKNLSPQMCQVNSSSPGSSFSNSNKGQISTLSSPPPQTNNPSPISNNSINNPNNFITNPNNFNSFNSNNNNHPGPGINFANRRRGSRPIPAEFFVKSLSICATSGSEGEFIGGGGGRNKGGGGGRKSKLLSSTRSSKSSYDEESLEQRRNEGEEEEDENSNLNNNGTVDLHLPNNGIVTLNVITNEQSQGSSSGQFSPAPPPPHSNSNSVSIKIPMLGKIGKCLSDSYAGHCRPQLIKQHRFINEEVSNNKINNTEIVIISEDKTSTIDEDEENENENENENEDIEHIV